MQPEPSSPTTPSQPGGTTNTGPTFVAKLSERPKDFPDRDVRAALVWIDGYSAPSCDEHACPHSREQSVKINSDVAVDVKFPLTLRLPVELTQPVSSKPYHTEEESSPLYPLHDVEFHSLPQAEVVLYVDGNHNQRLDLLPPGQPGPGPDRMLALSSGDDALGNAVRNVLVNKRSPLDEANELSPLPGLQMLVYPMPPQSPLRTDERGYADGVYVVHSSAVLGQELARTALLNSHGLYRGAENDMRWDTALLASVVSEIVPLADAEIELFPVAADRKTWLARGCESYPTVHGEVTPSAPPAGAEVLCGSGSLFYASNPDNYCGQIGYYSIAVGSDFGSSSLPDWWPCDAHGLKPDAPYVAATSRFDYDPLMRQTSIAINGTFDFPPPPDYACDVSNVLLDLDLDPTLHLPSMAPPAGSRVMCYSADALSYVPNTQCLTKFTYDLSSSMIPGYPEVFPSWDLRNDRPDWWPCDANGKLIAGRGYGEAESFGTQWCAEPIAKIVPVYYPPPPHSYIHCESATALVSEPFWSDGCDGRQAVATNGSAMIGNVGISWSGGPENFPGWPCDKDGKFIPMDGYLPL